MGVYQRTMQRLGHTTWFARIFKHTLPHIDRAISKLTGGRFTFGGSAAPTFILVHRGAKSGQEYRTPVLYMEDGANFALVASNWGGQNNPGWSYNLIANPDAAVVFKGETIPVRARRVSDEEKAQLWPRFTTLWPAFDTYKTRASHRNIKVFVLEKR